MCGLFRSGYVDVYLCCCFPRIEILMSSIPSLLHIHILPLSVCPFLLGIPIRFLWGIQSRFWFLSPLHLSTSLQMHLSSWPFPQQLFTNIFSMYSLYCKQLLRLMVSTIIFWVFTHMLYFTAFRTSSCLVTTYTCKENNGPRVCKRRAQEANIICNWLNRHTKPSIKSEATEPLNVFLAIAY